LTTFDKLVPANDRAEIAGNSKGKKDERFLPRMNERAIKSSAISSQTYGKFSTVKENVLSDTLRDTYPHDACARLSY